MDSCTWNYINWNIITIHKHKGELDIRDGEGNIPLHYYCITYYPHNGLDISYSCLLVYWTLPLEGVLELNVYGNFLEESLCLGIDGVIRNHRFIIIGGNTNVICEVIPLKQ